MDHLAGNGCSSTLLDVLEEIIAMRTEGVAFGNLTQCGDHMHLEWVCPDCGSSSFAGVESGPCRFFCCRSGREFLVVTNTFRTASVQPNDCVKSSVTPTRDAFFTSVVSAEQLEIRWP